MKDSLPLRLVCFLACSASIAVLLAKLYGAASMHSLGLELALPSGLLFVGIWMWSSRWGRHDLAIDLAIGVLSGLIATIGYDLVRIPFHLAGQRIFAPISAFGIWLTDAECSSRLTESVGWAYHYFNGIAFGVMYALFMRGRHWFWAVLWACGLETVAIISPFGRIFHLVGNPSGIAIAYLGHVVYGVPLGLFVQLWRETRAWLATVPRGVWWFAALLACAAVGGPLLTPGSGSPVAAGVFRTEGRRLTPEWLRIERGAEIKVLNTESTPITIISKPSESLRQIPAGGQAGFSFTAPGIYQFYVETAGRSHSSFVIVEPVDEAK